MVASRRLGMDWHGDPDRGFGKRQPGGWIFNALPYIEQRPLRKTGAGLNAVAKMSSLAKVAMTPLSILHCPTRCPAIAYPNFWNPYNITPVSTTAPHGLRRQHRLVILGFLDRPSAERRQPFDCRRPWFCLADELRVPTG